ncbi:nuclear transport factor 2 family protein [Pseudomonas sp. 21LCFQ02]|uniref:nuclear transport factor 2 family protein n=1 Tax=unclassified Pseudomonas TaxID=196821 RepID=UPI0004F5A1CA|nr:MULTISPECIES: nuclear transport factor 2 family protein [unclassified Pseudomonas]MCO8161338.1 nuclear transport factor 2 family protein [Pseudomonas sp. 21LCFQ010]MCO8168220.1 nuclear transport factor 2 family protein [Pseudomonas sp. 21LCFQ02]MCQ9426452.1 nuclear transport factor 2 family protein [Pseudomonas sp. LJDD11]BAP41519.1 SnoaL-like domain protein [Pseudomonas sp. StFLB209]
MSDFLQQFAHGFAALNKDNLDRLGQLYSEDVCFSDPLHNLQGLGQMREYFDQLYANVSELSFDFHGFDEVRPGAGYLLWTMHYRHPRLEGGKLLQVEGCSHLLWHDKVYRHRDYFDAGALLYEHLPVLGGVIGWLKRRLA